VRGRQGTTCLLTEVRHHAIAPVTESSDNDVHYSNDFIAIPPDLPFRPER
jgi:uncharacterized protein involved in type VI secretion and phage assembly